jgi:hypothetical protein
VDSCPRVEDVIEEIYRESVFGDVEAKIKVLQRENVQLKQELQVWRMYPSRVRGCFCALQLPSL